MPFNDAETSVEDSRVVELYQFMFQGDNFRYTSADRDVTHLSVKWSRMDGLFRTPIDESADISKAALTLTAPQDFPIATLFDDEPPDDVVGLAVRRLQYNLNESEVIWLGRVVNAKWPKDQSELRCESIYTQMLRPGLRRPYSKNCPHSLYGDECRVIEASFREAITITSSAGRSLVSSDFASFPDGYFAGGKLAWEQSPGYFVRRAIRTHDGDTVTISRPISSLPDGTIVSAAPGCDHTPTDCVNRFNNLPNMGGMTGMKRVNPFNSSSSVF